MLMPDVEYILELSKQNARQAYTWGKSSLIVSSILQCAFKASLCISSNTRAVFKVEGASSQELNERRLN